MKYFLSIFVCVFFLTMILLGFFERIGFWGIVAIIALIVALFGSALIKLSDRIDRLEEKLKSQESEKTEENETLNK